jgi:hypothetical protein
MSFPAKEHRLTKKGGRAGRGTRRREVAIPSLPVEISYGSITDRTVKEKAVEQEAMQSKT